jgi:hypothetical protein
LWQPGHLGIGLFRAHILGMESDPSNPLEVINGRRINGHSWGWTVEFQHIRLAKFPGEPLISWQRFDTLALAREAAKELGPIVEIDESEYASKTP